MNFLYRPLLAALGLLAFAAQAVAQEARVAAAADADVIAVYSSHIEKRLLRARVDRAAGTMSLVPFGPPKVEDFAVAPSGAFTVYSTTDDQIGNPVTSLFLLDEAGNALGKPLRSPVGTITGLTISPKGDRVAVSSSRGWLALLAVDGKGPARQLSVRAEIGVSADRQFSYAFRPDVGLVTMVDDWVATWRSSDGTVQRVLDLKSINPRDLVPADRDIGGAFQLFWSPRGDRFAVSWGPGPMMTTIFDSGGRRLQPGGVENDFDLPGSKVEFVEGGDALILYGMAAPVLVRMKSLANTGFGALGIDRGASVERFVPLPGGREIASLADDRIALWSLDGKQIAKPVGLENFRLVAAAAGAKDEVIVSAERGGWIDVFTREGKFLRRVQSGAQGGQGFVALSADGHGCRRWRQRARRDPGTAGPAGRAWSTALPLRAEPLVAVAGNGSRIVAADSKTSVRSWARDGTGDDSIPLKAGDQVPGRWLCGLAVSTTGDAIAVVEDGTAVWLASPADKGVRRLPLGARSVAPLPDGAGFAIGLADGTVARFSSEGTHLAPPIRASELGAVGRIVVAPDGQSFIAVEGDDGQARQLAWDGQVMAGPYRTGQSELIIGAFFSAAAPRLLVRTDGATPGEAIGVVIFSPLGERQIIALESPR